jgi:hypothetical protein
LNKDENGLRRSLPEVIEDFTAMLASGGSKKLNEEEKTHHRARINGTSDLYRFVLEHVQEIQKYLEKHRADDDEEWQYLTECMLIRNWKTGANCQHGGDRLSECQCVVDGRIRDGETGYDPHPY